MKVSAEFTDTYCGAANYSWVRRVTIEVPDTLSDRAIVRRVKAKLGLTGARPEGRIDYGDRIDLWYLDGSSTVLFISFEH